MVKKKLKIGALHWWMVFFIHQILWLYDFYLSNGTCTWCIKIFTVCVIKKIIIDKYRQQNVKKKKKIERDSHPISQNIFYRGLVLQIFLSLLLRFFFSFEKNNNYAVSLFTSHEIIEIYKQKLFITTNRTNYWE